MTVSLIGGLYGVGIAITVALCWLGYRTARTWDEPGATPFAAVMVLMGIGGFGGGVGTLVVGPSLGDATLWSQVGVAFFLLWCVPWALFGLQYTGRYTKVRPRTVGLLLAPYLGFLLLVGLQLATDIDLRVVDPLLGGAVFIYFFGLLSLGLYLVLQTTTVYDHLSLSQGLALALAPISNFLLINTSVRPAGHDDHGPTRPRTRVDAHTVGCNYVEVLSTPFWGESSTTYSRQYHRDHRRSS